MLEDHNFRMKDSKNSGGVDPDELELREKFIIESIKAVVVVGATRKYLIIAN